MEECGHRWNAQRIGTSRCATFPLRCHRTTPRDDMMFLTSMGIFPVVMLVIGLIGSLISLITLGVVVRSSNKD
jgi:antibiotic biosynthesis monooxygenase (ABM) superfamily enzyme